VAACRRLEAVDHFLLLRSSPSSTDDDGMARGSIRAAAGTQLPRPCAKGTGTLLDDILFYSTGVFSLAAYQPLLQMGDGNMLRIVLEQLQQQYAN
jgi:hypothetical protein